MESSTQASQKSSHLDCMLVVMAKAPRPGTVKTRLAQRLPMAAVTEFYRCLLSDTLTLARSLGTAQVAIMCPASDVAELSQFAGGAVHVVPQDGKGLAAGLTSVFAQFAAARKQRVVAFNSDSPHLPPSVLQAAFEALRSHDLVVGPTHDGGYYLVGAKASHPGLFAGDGMGTTTALQRLLSRAQALELSTSFTTPFYDIDLAEDLLRLASELQVTPAKAPRTAAWFTKWRHATSELWPAE
jgi:rSAM/selenodomain-associated transferase 1